MPIDTRDWYTEKRDDYKPPRNRWKLPRPLKSKLRPSKIFLIFLITACVVVTVYTGYLLFTHQTNWVVGAIVLAADIGVLIWNTAALKKWGVGAGTVISIFLVIAFLGATACAFGGVEPFSGAKNGIVGWLQGAGSQGGETQLPPTQDGVPVSAESAILGKWRHGLPEECPPSMDPRQYEEFKKLPASKTYYLEFLENGKVLYISEGEIIDGVYTFINNDYVEIVWNVLSGTFAWELFGGHGVYKVQISRNKMTLQGGTIGLNATYWRAN